MTRIEIARRAIERPLRLAAGGMVTTRLLLALLRDLRGLGCDDGRPALALHITLLRRHLPPDERIENVRGLGYRLVRAPSEGP